MSKRMIAPILMGIVGLAILLNLGAWQVRRLHWKEAALHAIAARLDAAPVALPTRPTESADEYLAVMAEGRILAGELHILTVRGDLGPGYRVIAPFETGGRLILIDRGFVPESRKGDPRPAGPASVTGNLHWPDETDPGYTPPPDLVRGIWFARDVPAMAAALGTESVLLVVRAEAGGESDLRPWPVDTSGIANDHLNYAITWFLLAAVWLGMTGYWLWRIRRQLD